MKNQKVLDHSQVQWYSDESMRLNYQLIFNDRAQEETKPEIQEDITELIAERDFRWKNKLKAAKEEAFKQGWQEGFTAGRTEASGEIDQKLAAIKDALVQAQSAWQQQQKMLEPGILDLSFHIAERILGIPVENPEIRNEMEMRLAELLQKLDNHSKPLLFISETDFEYVNKLKAEYAPHTPVNIRAEKGIKPGEFRLETRNETVIRDFKAMLDDFRQSLTVPSWS